MIIKQKQELVRFKFSEFLVDRVLGIVEGIADGLPGVENSRVEHFGKQNGGAVFHLFVLFYADYVRDLRLLEYLPALFWVAGVDNHEF